MQKKQARGGIERKFLKSILGVGFIPMLIVLVIGYGFSRNGQQKTAEQNLQTAARRTAEGIRRLELQNILSRNNRLRRDSAFIALFEEIGARGTWPTDLVPERFTDFMRDALSVDIEPVLAYNFYDADGNFVHRLSNTADEPSHHPEWVTLVGEYRYELLGGDGVETDSYSAHLITPIRSPQDNHLLGFLEEVHDSHNLLNFLLGKPSIPGQTLSAESRYEVLARHETSDRIIFLDTEASVAVPGSTEVIGNVLARSREADARLMRMVQSKPMNGSLRHHNYETGSTTESVLLAYHQLLPHSNLYIVVYRPISEVFGYLNLWAVLTITISLFVIAFFCVIAYRTVNNNVIRPVSLLNEGAQIIRQGDLELKLKIDTGDEIEELANSFNKMAFALLHNIRQLEDSEEKYRNLITSMRDGIYQTNSDGEITLINPAGVEILGYDTMPEVIGLNLRDLFIEQMDFARVTRELTKYRFVERMRVWMKKQDDTSICVELSTNRVFDDGAGFAGMEGTFRDVTQNVRLEREARERSDRINAINQIANVINSSLESGMVYESIVVEVKKLINFDYAAVSLLDEKEELFRTQRLWLEPKIASTGGGMKSTDAEEVRMDGKDSCAAWVAKERKSLILSDIASDAPRFSDQFPKGVISCVCVPLYATGKIIGTLNLGSNQPDAFTPDAIEVLEQMVPHFAVAIRNATLLDTLQHSLEDVTRARENLHEAIEELKTLDEMKTNLLSNVSHELRTPLVSVMGYTDMIYNGKVGPISDLQREYLGISLRNIEKLVTLIENLLDFSRLHRGDEELFFDRFDLVDCARTSMQIVRPVADSRKITLTLNPPQRADSSLVSEVIVDGDKGKLGQVFNNLLSNAVKFNKHAGTVTLDIRLHDESVEVTVSDTGIGMPSEALDKIFTRFYQYDASSTRKYGGTGIGLSISQDIMRLHGSSIIVNSEFGKGSTFRFMLPLSAVDRSSGTEPVARMPFPPETHLLIELVTQDRALSAQIRNLLVSEGMDVIHAAFPAVAISLAEKYSPDCILVDTEAGPLGSVVVEEILSQPMAEQVPIILLTNDDSLLERFRNQIAGRIKRGFRKSTLLSGIRYALSGSFHEDNRSSKKILCVDDDPEIVTFISRCLSTEGYQTDQCDTGDEALERLSGGGYWLVLLDIAMPGLGGWETCRRIKSNPDLEGVRVYMVTAKPIDKALDKVGECGADGYLVKPFKADDLLGLVQGFDWEHTGQVNEPVFGDMQGDEESARIGALTTPTPPTMTLSIVEDSSQTNGAS